MEAIAIGKFIKGSPQKARLVIDQIRGLDVEDAIELLKFSKRRSARHISKVLHSAIANAEEKSPSVEVEELFVKEAYVNSGPTKGRFRMRPEPMGRAFRQRRRQKHITIRLSDERS